MSTAVSAEAAVHEWVPSPTFGDRLVLLRRYLRLNQEEAARQCDLSPATWNTWEHGASPRSMDQVVTKIASATGCSREWLMWGSTSMYKSIRSLQAVPNSPELSTSAR